jgi:hypothetical protein
MILGSTRGRGPPQTSAAQHSPGTGAERKRLPDGNGSSGSPEIVVRGQDGDRGPPLASSKTAAEAALSTT